MIYMQYLQLLKSAFYKNILANIHHKEPYNVIFEKIKIELMINHTQYSIISNVTIASTF